MTMNCNFGIQVFSITGVTVDTQSKGGNPWGLLAGFYRMVQGGLKAPQSQMSVKAN
jgi:hypothetical protein